MLQQLVLAWRNVVRHRRRSMFAVLAVSAGVIAMLLASGFIEWSLRYGRESVIRAQLGHFQVVRAGYYDVGVADPSNYLLPADSPDLARLERIPGVEVIAPRMSLTGLVSHGESTLSFLGEGVEPGKEARLSRAISILHGVDLQPGDTDGVVVGRGLAANLGVRPGDRVVLLTSVPSGGVGAAEVTIRGIFGTIVRGYDDSVIRMPMAVAEGLTQARGAQVWAVLLTDESMLSDAIEGARGATEGRGLQVISWRELSDFYTKTEALFKRQLGIVKLIVALIIVLCIANTMYMSVAERTAEIGTILAFGLPRRRVLGLFVVEGLAIGVLGAVVGLVCGLLLALAISAVGIPMPPPPGGGDAYEAGIKLSGGLMFEALALAVGASVLASLVPAYKASRQEIVDALRRAVA